MKKILFSILSFFILPIVSFAVSNVNYDISNYYIKANILENGDMKVKELIVLDGSFNGYERTINFKNNALDSYDEINFEHSSIYNFDGIKDVKISGKYMNKVSYSNIDDNDYEEFSDNDFPVNGDKRKYIEYKDDSYNKYRMYYESKHNKVGFLIEYTVDNAVVMHNDLAELYWQIFTGDPDYNDDYEEVIVKVYLPNSDHSDNFRFWAHGPLSGTIKKIDSSNDGVVAEIGELDKSEDLDVRVIFDKDLILDDSELDHTYVDAFDGILEVEEKRAEEANLERERLKGIYNFFKYSSITLSVILGIGFIFIYLKYAKKPKTDFEAQYFREFIDDYNVEVIDYLMKKNITPNALSASIMNLIYKKNVEAEEIPNTKGKSSKKEYKFKLLNKDNLTDAESKLVSFLFETVGKDDEFTTKELKSYAASLKTGSTFNSTYNSWVKKVKADGISQGFYRSKSGAYIISVILLIVCFFFQSIGLSYGVDYPLLFLLIPLSIALLIYTASIKAYNEKGSLHVKKWNAFKNFLKDFGSFEAKELPEIKLWERYLVYAVIFGVAKKLQNDMNVKIKEFEELNNTTYSDTFTNLYIYDSIRSSFSNAVTQGRKQYAASRANAYSSSSSGGGFGGGFSSGGGFGGGGGGGHGF